jgi:glycosyltransferase involved in cell wall biosynthesis
MEIFMEKNMLVTFRLSVLGIGGTERVFLSVADYLSSTYRCSVDFVVDNVRGHPTEQIAIQKGYRVHSLDVGRTWKAIVPFSRYLMETNPSIVISAYTETNAAAVISNGLNRFRTPLIVTEHASLDEHWSNKSFLRKMLLEFMVRYIYRFADQISCVSRGMAEQLRKRVNHPKISYIHNPVRFNQRTLGKAEARRILGLEGDIRVVIAVGRISRQKNYLLLLQALAHLDSASKISLYIIGGVFEIDEMCRLERFISDHALGSQVKFVDFTHELPLYYEAADLLVLSSAWEGFGNVLVEALAFGLPIVSTQCNYGPAEILSDGEFGVLVGVKDHISLALAIQDVLTENPFKSELQTRRAQDFSEQRIGEAYYRLICETIGTRI